MIAARALREAAAELTSGWLRGTGIPYPDSATMCPGPCEGIGRYPVRVAEGMDPNDLRDWLALHGEVCKNPRGGYFACDGWHFIVCRDCHGTGKRLSHE